VFRPCWLHRRTDFSTNVSPPAQCAIGLYKPVTIRKSFTEAPLKRTFSEQHALRHYRMRAVSSYCCQYQPQQHGHTMMPHTELCVLLPARRDVRCASAGAIAMAMCLSVCVCLCLSLVETAERIELVFSTGLPSTYPTLCSTEIRVSSKIWVLPYETLSQTRVFASDFAMALT